MRAKIASATLCRSGPRPLTGPSHVRAAGIAPPFRDNDIDGEVLRGLTAEDLRDLRARVEGLDERVVSGFSWPRENHLHSIQMRPLIEQTSGELRAVVSDDSMAL